MIQKEWRYNEQAPEKFRKQFPEFSPLAQDILWQRGLRDKGAIERFFHPDYERDTHNPMLLSGMAKATARIHKAVRERRSIVLYGDYDTDGVSGLTILTEALRKLGCDTFSIYIPDRAKEGHGLHTNAVKEFVKNGTDLIVTVDCGITNSEEIAYAQEHGVDVVVTDHHQVIGTNPAHAIVNPHQKNDTYPFKDLCGAAVAFKVAQALLKDRIGAGQDKWFLDLVALATVTDVMPLVGENRVFLAYGLYVLAHQRRSGLRALMRNAGLTPTVAKEGIYTNLTPRALGFALGPRINAAGRIDHANTAYALMNATGPEEAIAYADTLEKTNKKRQAIIENIMGEIAKQGDAIATPSVIVTGSAQWPVGVLGIVASKLTEQYHKPAFLYEIREDEFRGSARSIPGFNIVEALSAAGAHLQKFGGHPQAGGFTGHLKDEEDFIRALTSYAEDIFTKGIAPPTLSIDGRINADQISWQLVDELERFAPFGEANPKPILAIDTMTIASIRAIGNGKKHLLLRLRDEHGKTWKALFFGTAQSHAYLQEGSIVSLAGELDVDEWKGRREIMLIIADIKVMV